MRVALGKIVVMCIGLLFGASTGREGPTVQVGAAIMHAIGRHSPYRQAGFLLAGASAGVAAAFNTPLAGIVFGIEEMSRSFEQRTSGLIVGAVIAAGLFSVAMLGDYSYFGATSASLPLGAGRLPLVACAVLGGATGGLFIRFVNFLSPPGCSGASARPRGAARRLRHALRPRRGPVRPERRPVHFRHRLRPGANGRPRRLGIDYLFGPLKFMATALSAISGIPGGVFSPSLAIGAGEASAVHLLSRRGRSPPWP